MTVRYFDWLEFVWTADLSPEAKLIGAYLTRFMNKDKDMAWPSQARIMQETGLKKATLNRRLNELESEDFILRESGNSKKTTRYILQIPNSLTERLLNSPTVSQGDHEQSPPETRVVSQGDTNISNTISPLIHQKEYSDSSPKNSPCPYEKIVDLYHQTLPTHPKVRVLTQARKSAIKQRHVSDMESDLETWASYFKMVGRSEFLSGRTQPINGRKVFIADLEWITKQGNFAKIYEGKYHE